MSRSIVTYSENGLFGGIDITRLSSRTRATPDDRHAELAKHLGNPKASRLPRSFAALRMTGSRRRLSCRILYFKFSLKNLTVSGQACSLAFLFAGLPPCCLRKP